MGCFGGGGLLILAILSWLWPVPVGLLIGATVLAPIVCDPGDPFGQFIYAGVGGVVGLILALIIRVVLSRRRHPNSPR